MSIINSIVKFITLSILLISLITSQSFAAAKAGTIIGNIATAIYEDDDGNSYATTSNLVETTVMQIYGINIEPSGDPAILKEGVAGQKVYFPYQLTNTGNGNDTYSLETVNIQGLYESIELTIDLNGNGIVDPGEGAYNGNEPKLAPDETVGLILSITIPSEAKEGDDNIKIDVRGTSNGDNTKQDITNIAEIDIINDAIITANKAVDKDRAKAGDILTYNINFKNIGTKNAKGVAVTIDGASSVGILITDSIPKGSAYTSNSSSGKPASNPDGYVVYHNGGNWSKTEPAAVAKIGFFMPEFDTDEKVLIAGQSGNLTFQVTVNSPFDDTDLSVDNIALIEYTLSDGSTPRETKTNETHTKIPENSVADISLGALKNPEEDDGNNYEDDNSLSNVPAGTWAVFKHTVKNNSLISDVINLEYDTNDLQLPQEAIIEFWDKDGANKLFDTNFDDKLDVGNVKPNEVKDFTVKVYIPANTPASISDNQPNYWLTIIASSVNNTKEIDKSRDNIDNVTAPGVDIATNNQAGDFDPSDDNASVRTTDPCVTIAYQFDINNTGGNKDSYDLSEIDLQEGVKIAYYTDPNDDGDYADGKQIYNTGVLNPQEKIDLLAIVTLPCDLDPKSYTPQIKATSTTNKDINDQFAIPFTINVVCKIAVAPDNRGQVEPGGTISYLHTLSNNGNIERNITVTGSSTAKLLQYQFSADIENNQTAISYDPQSGFTLTLKKGGKFDFEVNVNAPENITVNTLDVFNLLANGGGECSAKAADTTTIVDNMIKLIKETDKTEAKPGETITFRMRYRNIGSKDVKNAVLSDKIPDYTTYVAGSAAFDDNCDGNASGTLGTIEDTNADKIIKWTFDNDIKPGQEGCVVFKVKVD